MEDIGGDSIYLSPFARLEMRRLSYKVYASANIGSLAFGHTHRTRL
jgi:hypothetical protein